MRPTDVPQAPSLAKVRDLVQSVASGANTRAALDRTGLLSRRHIGYYLHAARILGLLDTNGEPYILTPLGRELVAAARGSEIERDVLRRAILASDALTHAAPGLLDNDAPDRDKLATRIAELTKMQPATAHHRAVDLLSWRRVLVGPRTASLFPEAAPPTSRVQQGVAEGEPRRARSQPSVLRLCQLTVERYGPHCHVVAPLQDLTVLVGANAAGKSTLFDAIQFVADALTSNVVKAVLHKRASDVHDLFWYRSGESFAFAFDFDLPPDDLRPGSRGRLLDGARYELEIGVLDAGSFGVRRENLFLVPSGHDQHEACHRQTPVGWKKIFTTSPAGNAQYTSERSEWSFPLHVGNVELALGKIPGDQDKFPIAHTVRDFFRLGVVSLALHSAAMRSSVSPWRPESRPFEPDGSNLPLLVLELAKTPERFHDWLAHAREALPNLRHIDVAERPENRELFLTATYDDGLVLPAWRLSDGTLRILALTLLGFVAQVPGIFLVEEPENGVHPQAIEAIFQALCAGHGRQLLIATHSPVMLGVVPPDKMLCLANRDGRTVVTPGSRHPALKDWHKQADLGMLFAAGLL